MRVSTGFVAVALACVAVSTHATTLRGELSQEFNKKKALGALKTAGNMIVDAAPDLLSSLFLEDQLSQEFDKKKALGALKTAGNMIVDAAPDLLSSLFLEDQLSQEFSKKKALGALKAAGNVLVDAAPDLLSSLFLEDQGAGHRALNAAKSIASGVVNAIPNLITSAIMLEDEKVAPTFQKLKGMLSKEGLEKIKKVRARVQAKFKNPQLLEDQGAGHRALNAAKSIASGVVNAIPNLITSAIMLEDEKVAPTFQKLKGMLSKEGLEKIKKVRARVQAKLNN